MFEEIQEFIAIGGLIVALTLIHVAWDRLGEWRKKRKEREVEK